MLGFHDAGSGWVAWPAHPANYGHWQVAACGRGRRLPPNCRVYAYLYGTEYDAAGAGWNSLACQQVQVIEQRRVHGVGYAHSRGSCRRVRRGGL